MIRTSTLAIAVVVAVASGAIVGTATTDVSRTGDTSCTCSTIDVGSGSVTLVVLANGTGGTSVNQQISQTNGHTQVHIDVEYGETSVKIEGETVTNGSLVLNVTRNGAVVNQSVEVSGDEEQTLVFHVDGNENVRITREDELKTCESVCGLSDGVNVDVQDDVGDGVGTDVEVNVGDEIEVNVSDDETPDVASDTECAKPTVEDEEGSSDISRPPKHSSVATSVGTGLLQVVVQSPPVAGLATPDGGNDCGKTTEGVAGQQLTRDSHSN